MTHQKTQRGTRTTYESAATFTCRHCGQQHSKGTAADLIIHCPCGTGRPHLTCTATPGQLAYRKPATDTDAITESAASAEVWPCTWLVEGRDEDGATYLDCGAPTRYRADGTGYDCDAGHEETYAEARNRQGWDYAEDEPEARRLTRNGVEPRTMTGQVWPS